MLGFPPADRKRLWELDMHALWTKTQLLALTISFGHPGIWPGGTMFVTVPAPRLQEQQGSQRPEGTQVCLALQRPLYTDLLVKLPTWALREPKQF